MQSVAIGEKLATKRWYPRRDRSFVAGFLSAEVTDPRQARAADSTEAPHSVQKACSL